MKRDDGWISRLLWLRAALGLKQSEFLEKLKDDARAHNKRHPIPEKMVIGQSTLSRWENGTTPLPDWVQEALGRMEQLPEAKQFAREDTDSNPSDNKRDKGLVSKEHSYPVALFNMLAKEGLTTIGHMIGEFVVKPSAKSTPGYADIDQTLTLLDVTAPRPLWLDCIGIPRGLGRDGVPESEQTENDLLGSEAEFMGWKSDDAKVNPEPRVAKLIGPHALAYKIESMHKGGEIRRVDVKMRAKRALRTDSVDSVGVPCYGDYLTRKLTLKVRFEGITPKALVPQVYLLRRTPLGSRPVSLDDPLKLWVLSPKSHEYTLSGLLRPKAGWGYCLAWNSLTKS